MSEEPEGSDRTYWHSEHYRGQIGNSLEGPIWDVLAAHPDGVTVPQIRDALVNDRRIRAAQSWFVSFGAEQRHRAGAQFEQRYRQMDQKSSDREIWTWTAEQRYRYALTERIHWFIRSMIKHEEAVFVGVSSDEVQNSEVLYLITGRSRQLSGGLPTYTAGKVPLVTDINPQCSCGKSHHKTYKRPWVRGEGLGPDPFVMAENWRVDVETALLAGRLTHARELLERGLELMRTGVL